ncbi:DNA polymerase III subunit epsilon [Hahella sp. KA22]|uniref:DNA polymerase III subunit epsilon n=1 Tax=Hahella sp. KA22 TaxID=1628392 RepID=UPI000FDD0233|nr:DNA polymerase III subunit epsilon [Hahella sp. KA22]AZZ91789.1 DNA polymerase III subunit epsilon [Hahella sp. KA22]QAY55159.1 DNA polymerase III subunit epsilon [Hahella sp. KA22]
MRQIVLDTETTGLETSQGHRIIEIGCVEVVDRSLTGNHYHVYINPEREVDAGAFEVHGISNEFLADKPKFKQVAQDFLDFINGAELVIHNAAFDVGFIDYEFSMLGAPFGKVSDYCSVVDTLMMARKKHPGQKNNLDALCKRYGIDNSHRDLHGALLDSEILADVYLAMTGGQTSLSLHSEDGGAEEEASEVRRINMQRPSLRVIRASEAELAEHARQLDAVEKAAGFSLWRKKPEEGVN